jgi:Trk-type K+ transport system membrane component
MTTFRQALDQLNELIYSTREQILRGLDIFTNVSLLTSLAILIYALGGDLEADDISRGFRWLEAIIAIFVVDYIIRVLYSFHRWQFIKEKLLESILVSIFLAVSLANLINLDIFYYLFFLTSFTDFRNFYEFFIIIYVLILFIISTAKASVFLASVQIQPATMFIISFIVLILGGGLFLMMPAMTTMKGSMRFIDAVFTSASAACVTGLAVQDTATFFTVKGQVVILILIQLGGIGIVSFATFFATFLSQGVGLKQQAMIKDVLSTETLGEAKNTLRQVIMLTFLIEITGAVFIFLAWDKKVDFYTPLPQREQISYLNENQQIIFKDIQQKSQNIQPKDTIIPKKNETEKSEILVVGENNTENTDTSKTEMIVVENSDKNITETQKDTTKTALAVVPPPAPPSKELNNALYNKIWYSIFHSVSAFCNAGFSLYSNGLNEDVINQCYVLHICIAFIIIFGSLGYNTITDVFSPKRLRERMKMPWKQWTLGSQIAVNMTIVLGIGGMILFFFLEQKQSLAGKNMFEQLVISFFQSITTRTAGFNTVTLNVSSITTATYLLIIFLMFIGAASGSTGGGIKTSTFLMLVYATLASIRGKKNVEMGKRTIAAETINQAFSIVTFAIAYNAICIFLLCIVQDNMDIRQLFFEQMSAFATVGLSLETTPFLNDWSKSIIILTMYVGRVGTLTLALALTKKVASTSYKYPSAHVMVG